MISIVPYTEYVESEIMSLYESVGWVNYTLNPAMLKQAFAHSLCVFAAYDGQKLTGIARAVGDGFSIVYIQDILVAPDYRRRGIGTALIGKILETYKGAYQISLLTDDTESSVGFYKSQGFALAAERGCAAFVKFG